jgi:hypothetical protein
METRKDNSKNNTKELKKDSKESSKKDNKEGLKKENQGVSQTDQVKDEFQKNLYEFIDNLYKLCKKTITNKEKIKKLRKLHKHKEDLSIETILTWYADTYRPFASKILQLDVNLLKNKELSILPMVDLQSLEQIIDNPAFQRLLWAHLPILYIEGEIWVNREEKNKKKVEQLLNLLTSVKVSIRNMIYVMEQKEKEGNSQAKQNSKISLSSILENMETSGKYKSEGDSKGSGMFTNKMNMQMLGMVMKMLGMNQMIDPQNFVDRMRSLSSKQILNASKSLQQFFIKDGKKKIAKTIEKIGKRLVRELKKQDLTKIKTQQQTIEKIMEIANAVREEINPELESGELNAKEVLFTLANQMDTNDEKGKSMHRTLETIGTLLDKTKDQKDMTPMKAFEMLKETLTENKDPIVNSKIFEKAKEVLVKMGSEEGGITPDKLVDLVNVMKTEEEHENKKDNGEETRKDNNRKDDKDDEPPELVEDN